MIANAAFQAAFDTAEELTRVREDLAAARERHRGMKVLAWVSLSAVLGWLLAGYLLVMVAVR